jgi:hypothetical protein
VEILPCVRLIEIVKEIFAEKLAHACVVLVSSCVRLRKSLKRVERSAENVCYGGVDGRYLATS